MWPRALPMWPSNSCCVSTDTRWIAWSNVSKAPLAVPGPAASAAAMACCESPFESSCWILAWAERYDVKAATALFSDVRSSPAATPRVACPRRPVLKFGPPNSFTAASNAWYWSAPLPRAMSAKLSLLLAPKAVTRAWARTLSASVRSRAAATWLPSVTSENSVQPISSTETAVAATRPTLNTRLVRRRRKTWAATSATKSTAAATTTPAVATTPPAAA